MTATELKKRAIALAEKTKIDSVTPEEVGQLSNDIVEYIENVEINGSSLGIRKTYTSVSAMEADSTAPKDDKGVLLRRGMLVNIYNQSDPDSADNGKVFSFQNPGWAFRGTVDSGYATNEELTELYNQINNVTELCTKLKSGGYSYIGEDGENVSAGDGKSYITDFIPVSNLKSFKYKLGTICPGKNAALIAAYDSSKLFIKEKSVISEGNRLLKKGIYIVDESISFIKICYNIGLDVSCISSSKVPLIYEEDVEELLANLKLTTNKITDENEGKTQDYLNKEFKDSIHLARLRGLLPYGIFLTKEDFTLNQNYDNAGNKYASSTFVSTSPIKLNLKSFFSLLYKGNSLAFESQYNIILVWKDNPETAGYSGDNKLFNKGLSSNTDVFSTNIYLDNVDSVYVSFTIPKKNLSEATIVSFGLFDNYIEECKENLDFLLGSLKKRINLSSEILDGWMVTDKGQIDTAGGTNFNTYVIKVSEGKTYYFYNKLSDNSVEAISLNWATRNKNKLEIGSQTLHYGTGVSANIQSGDEYLYVGISKSKGILMVSDTEQTRYYEPDNLVYIELKELKEKVSLLEEKGDEKISILGFNYLEKHRLEKNYSGSEYSMSNVSSSSQLSDYTDYAALVGTDKLNNIFRFSSPACRIRTEMYPNNLVIDDRNPLLGFTVEFYCSASSFEIMGFTNYFAGVVVDGEFLGQKNGQESGRNYIFINLTTAKKRLIKLYLSSNSFYGIRCNNDGSITAVDTKKFLCAYDGDSVVEGSNAGTKMALWAQIASTMLGVDCFNCAMGGTGYGKDLQSASRENMIDRFENQIAQYNPDILIVSAGINDADEGFETYVDNYYSQAKRLLPKCKIVVCSNYFNKTASDSNWSKAETKCEILRKAALKYELPFIDYLHRLTYDSLGNLITNNIGTDVNTNLITEENYSEFIDADSDITHPTPYGHLVMGKYIGNELFKVLKDANGFVDSL